ncbi:hypothetical protein [Dyadobacter aurulentus]|uniref:hypothetical protein n=1 Tax=Dyadobacter sp. UC 10 TaxID=2605428 RepID=UPI0011F3B46F|nr:hypothetical protein [Dyadobacter sp. UC 10]KAA0988934.1 hypothetical protein FXO21_01530 [Dyadobacter sp. UC 10]
MKLFHIISAVCICTLLISCNHEGPKADCGCDGPTTKRFQDVAVSYLGDGYFLVPQKKEGSSYSDQITALIACNMDSSWAVSTSPTIANYIISGNMKMSCPDDFNRLWEGYQPATITKIEAKR